MKSTDLSAMLEALGGAVSDSKLRLFACACCRRIWDLINTDLHRRAMEYAEWFARGPGRDLEWLGTGNWTRRQLSRPLEQIEQTEGWKEINRELQAEQNDLDEETAAFRYDNCTPQGTAACILHLRYDMPYYVPRGVAVLRTAPFAYWQHSHSSELSYAEEQQWGVRIEQEMVTYCDLLRDVYGPLAFRPVNLPQDWLRWNGGIIAHLAQAIQEERAYYHMPILADALEDAGCTSAELLDHLRRPGPHVLGCWGLDLVLAKE
jgi:hypothetical protein